MGYKARPLNSNLDIFSTTTNVNTYKMYQIDNNSIITDITPSTYNIYNVGQGVYKVNVTLPNVDCIVCSILNGSVLFLKVGNPIIRYLYYKGTTSLVIPYIREDTSGTILENSNLTEYGYGIYGFIPTDTTHSIITVESNSIALDVNYSQTSGSITLNYTPGVATWQQIAIPVNNTTVKNYFLDGLDVLIKTYDNTKSVLDVVERVSAYPGNVNKFLTFIPGITPATSEGNFPLTITDGNSVEITAFWVKIKDYGAITNNTSLVFNWSAI